MNVLVACEYSGTVRDAFRKKGHNAISCDLLDTDVEGPHHKGDVLGFIRGGGVKFDLMLAFPPCTYLCSSGLHWNTKRPERAQKTEDALEFVRQLLEADVGKICLENPLGCISTRIRPPDQTVQPWQFGEPESKETCFWLKGLPLLKPTNILDPPRRVDDGVQMALGLPDFVPGTARWDNQTDSGQNKLTPSDDRWKIRSKTYQGIADAMAEQWG